MPDLAKGQVAVVLLLMGQGIAGVRDEGELEGGAQNIDTDTSRCCAVKSRG
jgi:hypothetical protein